MSAARRLNPFPIDPTYAGIYTHGVAVPPSHCTVYVSGQVGVAPDGALAEDFRGQCQQAIRNVESVLRESNMQPDDVVKMSFFLTRREDMETLVEVRKSLLDGIAPAITTVVVAGLVSPDWLVEVEAYACSDRPVSSSVKHLGSI